MLRPLVSTCLLLSTLPLPARTSDAQELERLSRARFAAIVQRDENSLVRYYTPDFIAYTDGKKLGIDFLRNLMRTAARDLSLDPDDYSVLVSADRSLAVVTHITRDTLAGDHTVTRYTEVYVSAAGGWKLKQEQFAEDPKPQNSPR